MTTTLFDQALAAARQLPPRERARLVAAVVDELAEPIVTTPQPTNDAWEQLERLRKEFAQLPRSEGTVADQLERDRAERQAMLEGRSNVHA